ncbi:MAG TPA: response regulator [Acidobacteriota bacterium]|nr:response regulator [Acidobacteriota bacterium]
MSSEKKSQPLRAVIVDDEDLARQALAAELEEHPQVKVIAQCANGFEAVKVIGDEEPDLVFLDIQMPKLDGFEVLELLDDPPHVIFVTAYDEYALKAFEVHAVDYLLKPLDPERLSEALERAAGRAKPGAASQDQRSGPFPPGSAKGGHEGAPLDVAAVAAAARPRRKFLERILIKEGGDITVVPVDSIDYLEAQDDYVNVVTGGKGRLKQQRMAYYEKHLPQGRFVRVHRSYILNLDRLARLELYAKDSRIATLRDGSKIPVSRSGYARLKHHLDR